MSWFTRTAADHPRGTAPSRCGVPDAPAREDNVREPVINLSVVTTRLSMDLAFTKDNQGRRLAPLKVRDRQSIYQKQSLQARPLALYEICGDTILRTLRVPCAELVEVRHCACRDQLWRPGRQIWSIRESLALKHKSVMNKR